MSVEDETSNRCPYCKVGIRIWQDEEYHSSRSCLHYKTYGEWREKNDLLLIEKSTNKELIESLQRSQDGLEFHQEYFGSLTYIPEIWEVEEDLIYALKIAAQNGLEYAQECLSEHDIRLGRTIRRNKEWAATMEADIRQMEQALETLNKYEQQRN